MMTPEMIKEKLWNTTFTLQGRIFHNELLKPALDNEDATKPPKYSTMFVFPKGSNPQEMARLQAFLNEMRMAIMPNIPPQHLVFPIKDYDTYVRQKGGANPEYTKGCYWINASSGEKVPPYIGKQGPVPGSYTQLREGDEAETYSGRNAAIQITFYALTGGKDGKGKWGFSANVKAVLLLPGGERHSGGTQVDPTAVFGNFQVDMGLIQQGGAAPQDLGAPVQQGFGTPQGNPFGAPAQNAAPGMNPFGAQATTPVNGAQNWSTGQTAQQTASPSNPFAAPQQQQQQYAQQPAAGAMPGPWNQNNGGWGGV